MKYQKEINNRCLSLIENLKLICWHTTIDIAAAELDGLKDYDFSKQDLKKLKKIHDNFIKANNKIPDFESILLWDESI